MTCRQLRQERVPCLESLEEGDEILSRHQNLLRDFAGAIEWCSLLPTLRRESEIGGAGVFSDFQWLNLIHRRSDKPRFQYCLDRNENLMYIRAIQGHSGGALVDPELLNCVEIPFGWKEHLFHVECTLNNALHHASSTESRWKRHQRRTAHCLLHSSGPFGQ